MKKIVLASVALLFSAHLASAQVAAPRRTLTCTNSKGSLSIDICGIRGCPASLTVNKTTTELSLTRKKNTDGSLTYTTKSGTAPRCTIQISALRAGSRPVQSASCARPLVGAPCKIIVGDISTPTPTATATPAE